MSFDTDSELKRGAIVDLDIERIDERGRGVTRMGDKTILTRFAGPGTRVRARLGRGKGKDVLSGHLFEILDPGPFASPSRCPHAGVCGGCALPRTSYAAQIAEKHGIVARAVHAALGSAADLVEDVGPAHELEGYRNKMDFTFGDRRYVDLDEPENADTSFALGLHAPALWSKVLDIKHCAIAFEGASEIVRDARTLARAHGLEPWNQRDHTGLLRHLVLRRGARTGDTLVNLVTSERAAKRVDPYVRELLAVQPGVTTLVQSTTSRQSTVAIGDAEHIHWGEGTIHEVIAGKRFAISADSFFQTNTVQAERLFDLIARAASLEEGQTLFDLYCGAGTIGLAIAPPGTRLVGFESVPSAVRDARRNAVANGVQDRATFIEGDVLESLESVSSDERPDAVIVDPPRAGLHPKVPDHVAALGAPRLVYVSCNPKTGARDVRHFVDSGYQLRSIRPIDLFPHTPHVEVVFELAR